MARQRNVTGQDLRQCPVHSAVVRQHGSTPGQSALFCAARHPMRPTLGRKLIHRGTCLDVMRSAVHPTRRLGSQTFRRRVFRLILSFSDEHGINTVRMQGSFRVGEVFLARARGVCLLLLTNTRMTSVATRWRSAGSTVTVYPIRPIIHDLHLLSTSLASSGLALRPGPQDHRRLTVLRR